MQFIMITQEEACLIDYLITMHSFDYSMMEFLKQPMVVELRKKAGRVILEGEENKEMSMDILSEEIEYLLTVVPITFRFLENDVGYSLKKKLFSCVLPKSLKLSLEMFEVKPEEPKEEVVENKPADNPVIDTTDPPPGDCGTDPNTYYTTYTSPDCS